MFFNDLSKFLNSKFTLENYKYLLDDKVICQTYNFSSDVYYQFYDDKEQFNINIAGNNLENGLKENRNFRYAVFAPSQHVKFSEAIIMLHGLNERKWEKYLPWAYQLVFHTKKPVILFPIAFHINRSPNTWNCPRLMNEFSSFRRETTPSIKNSSFANIAISLRMDNFPELFSLSGIQTYFDIIKLSSEIKSGSFNIFEKNCKIDFFAYSIGAFLTETLLISNPLNLFSNSKAFFFCGGTTFDKINGDSRAIMDSKAFGNLRNYILNENFSLPQVEMILPRNQEHLLKEGWKAFLIMSGLKKYNNIRDKVLKRLINRIKVIGLKDDFVIPGKAIKETFNKLMDTNFDVLILDFPFKYSHEVPFPVNNQNFSYTINRAFNFVFKKASLFLN